MRCVYQTRFSSGLRNSDPSHHEPAESEQLFLFQAPNVLSFGSLWRTKIRPSHPRTRIPSSAGLRLPQVSRLPRVHVCGSCWAVPGCSSSSPPPTRVARSAAPGSSRRLRENCSVRRPSSSRTCGVCSAAFFRVDLESSSTIIFVVTFALLGYSCIGNLELDVLLCSTWIGIGLLSIMHRTAGPCPATLYKFATATVHDRAREMHTA